MVDRLGSIDFKRLVLVGGDTVTIRFVSFSKWSSFFENVYVLSRGDGQVKLIDPQWNPLIEYDCSFTFSGANKSVS